jgi:hypothetical protein
MNIYVLIEGERATKKLYTHWIRYANKNLSPVDDLRNLSSNKFFIQAGFGQPGYWNRVEKAVDDVNNIKSIDRLVISVDSEEGGYFEKLTEAKQRVERAKCRVDVKYIIQNFCLETWLLGNVNVFRKRPQEQDLKEFMCLFDVRLNDPELLPANKKYSWNRAQFAFRYLKAGIRDVYGNQKFYSKSDPGLTAEEGYFYQVKRRHLKERHLASFSSFLDAFI